MENELKELAFIYNVHLEWGYIPSISEIPMDEFLENTNTSDYDFSDDEIEKILDKYEVWELSHIIEKTFELLKKSNYLKIN